jgi:uncharacterized cupredoxin-like copper-binding protein
VARIKFGSVVIALALVVALAGCSSSKKSSSSTSSTAAGGGITVTTPATGSTVNIVVSDTSGLTGPMTLTATPSSLKAGDITFVVKNTGTIEHEVIVLPLPAGTAYNKLPLTDGGDPPAPVATGADKVSEAASVGETGDPAVQPGESRTFTVKAMPAGNYALVCNIAQHYAMGMEAPFTVS